MYVEFTLLKRFLVPNLSSMLVPVIMWKSKCTVTDLPHTVANSRMLRIFSESDIYFQICNPYRATFDISNMRGVLLERAQLTLRHVVGARGVRSVLTEREDIASEITDIVNDIANKWGVAIESILIKDISTEISADASVGESEVIAIKSQTVKPPKALPKTLQKVRPNSWVRLHLVVVNSTSYYQILLIKLSWFLTIRFVPEEARNAPWCRRRCVRRKNRSCTVVYLFVNEF